MKSINVATVSAWAAHALAWAPGFYFAFVPAYQGVTGTPSRPGEAANEVTRTSATLIEQNGPYVILLLLLPVLLTAIALLALRLPKNRQVLRKVLFCSPGVVLLGFCIVAIWSIGLFYVPAALALFISAIAERGRQEGNQRI